MTPAQQKVVDSMHKAAKSGLYSDRILHQTAIADAGMAPMEPISEEENLIEVLKLEERLATAMALGDRLEKLLIDNDIIQKT